MTLRWPGMIQKNTLALIDVAIIAPTSRNAARPANRWQASHAAKTTKAGDAEADDQVALLAAAEGAADHVVDDPEHDRKASAAAIAPAGVQAYRLLSIRKLLAWYRYSTVKRAKPVSQVE